MANYSTDTDLQFRRPDILDLGVDNFDAYHAAAADTINRYLDKNWYQNNAVEKGVDITTDPFDPANITDPTQLNDASTYLVLSMVYESMRKNVIEDGYGKLMDDYKAMFNDEIRLVVNYGISYDWSGTESKSTKRPRVLKRA